MMIKLQDVHLHFGAHHALRGINLDVKQGEVISILGPSGSGKSTLLRCLNLLERPTKGKIYIDGDNILGSHFDVTRLRRHVGMIFQGFNLFPHLTVLNNITLAPQNVRGLQVEDAEERAHALLKKVGLYNQAHKHPNQLSGGQKQRVAIARALAMEPNILLLDEPTSALDPEMVKEVMCVIQTLQEDNITMLAVSHEMSFAKNIAQRLLFMDEGQIIEDTTPNAFFNNPQTTRAKAFLDQINY